MLKNFFDLKMLNLRVGTNKKAHKTTNQSQLQMLLIKTNFRLSLQNSNEM